MTTAATSLLGLALPVTGELSGTWGSTVNDSITSLLDTAVAGTTTLSTDGDVTLSTTTLAANQARQAILLCTGARTALRTITAPAQSKIYTVINATTGGYSVKVVGAGPTTGVTIVAGESALIAWNGSDFIKISNTGGAASFTDVTVSGNVTLSGGTANGVAYLNGSKVLTTGSALTFDGATFGIGVNTLFDNSKELRWKNASGVARPVLQIYSDNNLYLDSEDGAQIYRTLGTERMRLTSTGLGIGTSSPGAKLDVAAGSGSIFAKFTSSNADPYLKLQNTSAAGKDWIIYSSGTGSGVPGAIRFFNNTDNFTALTLDSSGNLGLGVTPSATPAGVKSINVGSQGYVWGDGVTYKYNAGITNNAYVNGNNSFAAITSRGASIFELNGDTFLWKQASTGTAGSTLSLTQAMTLDASGNLGVGTTSPGLKLHVYGGSGSNGIQLQAQYPWATFVNLAGTRMGYIQHDATDLNIWQDLAGAIRFGTNNTERARITSGGYFKASDNGTYNSSTGAYHELYQSANAAAVLIRAANASFADIANLTYVDRNTTNNTFYALAYYNVGASAYRFYVADSGNVTNTNGSYGTISDAKMKTDIVDAGSQWEDIKAIRFRKFKMKNDPSGLLQLGVVAQELEQTSPGLVDEHTDRDAEGNNLGTTTKSVKTSVLLMKAAVALQEAMARIEKLEAEVAALKGA